MKYGLVGKSLVHSYSKEIHEALGKYSYELFSLSESELPGFIKAGDFAGLNVTIPYKKDVMAMCDEISPLAAEIGAVNTIYRKGSLLIGHNTDYEGFIYAAQREHMDFRGKNVLILGSGGTSLMARKTAEHMGALRVITASRRQTDVTGIKDSVSYEQLSSIAALVDIIVNTTPVGTYPNNGESLISLRDFPGCRAVIDVIYNPFKTKLLLEAEELGLKFSNGLPMLVAQATAAAGYFLGTPDAFACENERIINQIKLRMGNVVLIGMPGSGKTTLGRLIAEKTGREFVDMDEEISKKASMTVPQIFAEEGEDGFRARERDAAASLGKGHGRVIAAGGGAVLWKENADTLRQNGYIIHVLRPVERLATSGRPLSSDMDALKKMESERMPVYREMADASFDNSAELTRQELADAVSKILSL